VIHCESSAEVWLSLKNLYSHQTIANSFQLKQQLRSIKKDALSVNDYILKIKTIGHTLATIGEPLNDKDLLLAILNGLNQDYETVVSLITYQMDEINLEKVQYLLSMHEQKLLVKNSPQSSISFDSMHVNVAFVPTQNNSFDKNRGNYS